MNDHPHTCNCGSSAYIGAMKIECTNPSCEHYVPVKVQTLEKDWSEVSCNLELGSCVRVKDTRQSSGWSHDNMDKFIGNLYKIIEINKDYYNKVIYYLDGGEAYYFEACDLELIVTK